MYYLSDNKRAMVFFWGVNFPSFSLVLPLAKGEICVFLHSILYCSYKINKIFVLIDRKSFSIVQRCQYHKGHVCINSKLAREHLTNNSASICACCRAVDELPKSKHHNAMVTPKMHYFHVFWTIWRFFS